MAGASSALDLPPHPDLRFLTHRGRGFFSTLTRRRLRRGTFTGVVDLQAAIKRYIAEHSSRARPFTWTHPAAEIVRAVSRLAGMIRLRQCFRSGPHSRRSPSP